MDKQFQVFAPLGRLYDPLQQLAERVHRALLIREKTVWTDDNGYVFATPTDLLRTISPHATIGLYAKWTPLPMIEMGLRFALRQRASAWIVDWRAAYSLATRGTDEHIVRFAPPRMSRRKRAPARTRAAPPPNVGQASSPQPHF